MQYEIKRDLLLQAVADETVILDPSTGNYYTLDSVGTRMVELLQNTKSIDAVVEGILAEYESSAVTVRNDLFELLEAMAEHGLVKKSDA
ncbi:MAG: PqqD family protein [Candidatus Thiodiazotropha sp.]|jgi:hypothetical protein